MTQTMNGLCGGRRRRGPQPFRQGDLDGLCGVYSVVNAVRVLCPELGQDGAEWLFDHLMQSLQRLGADAGVSVSAGVGQRVVASLIKEAILQMAAEYDIDMTCRRLPKLLRRTTNLDRLWTKLAITLSPTCVAVLATSGQLSHWTVAVSATPRLIRLYDSCTIRLLRRGDCTIGRAVNRIGISLPHVFLIRRKVGA